MTLFRNGLAWGRAKRAALWLLGITLLAGVVTVRAEDGATVQYAPPGQWVSAHFVGQRSLNGLESGADERVLLLEQQINVASNETFVHSIRQILTTAGVQKGSTITVDFSPSYESLTFHWARLWRNGQHWERLDTNQVKVVQREQDLDEYILNGRKSAMLVVDDVRVGDTIDYAYSIKGTNPVFNGHFSAEVPLQLNEAADRLLTRVLWPKPKRLFAQAHGCAVQPRVVTGTNVVEYIWDYEQLPSLALEDSLPGWYNPEPWVQLTDFASWAEVNHWALSLFHVDGALSPELSHKIGEWKQLPDREQQILAALRFVQDEVRYFGVEVGIATEKPADPSVVFARRYGDCKDKSWLFVTILRALGVEAYPVLVNSTMGRDLDNWRPSVDAFDHCIAVVRFNEQFYWVDPTINYQGGPLAGHYLPPYERGLVIAPKTATLAVIPPAANAAQTTTTEYFQVGGRNEPANLKVVTVAVGRDADGLRELFATKKRGDIEKDYTHFYSSSYPGIRMSAPVDMVDNEEANVIQTTEYYALDKMWTKSDQDGKYHCDFYPASILALLQKPHDTDRLMPFGIGFPEHQIVRTEVTLPQAWPSETQTKSISDAAFTFQKSYRCAGNKLVMQYEYQAQADSVAPGLVGQYLQSVDETSKAMGYTLVWK